MMLHLYMALCLAVVGQLLVADAKEREKEEKNNNNCIYMEDMHNK